MISFRTKRFTTVVVAVIGAWLGAAVWPTPAWADWPTYAGNDARHNASAQSPTMPLVEAWTWRSRHRPKPAWGGPAKADKYNKPGVLAARVAFDTAFHVVAADGLVFFGSSVDDKVYCLDATSGEKTWQFYTEGPVRCAPTIANGRVYFGSDDGVLYCLDAYSGKVVWQKRVGPSDRRVPGNGRVISVWPVRTGVVVRDGLVYAGAGVFPSEGVHLKAFDANDGTVKWHTTINDLPIQGYLLASPTRLYAPTGRDNPIVFDRKTGQRLLTITKSQGGTYCLLTPDHHLVFGPGKTGRLDLVEQDHKDKLATFAGNHMIVAAGMSYLHTDTQLSALDRATYLAELNARRPLEAKRAALGKQLKAVAKDKAKADPLRAQIAALTKQIDTHAKNMAACLKWRNRCGEPHALILAGDVLFAGGDGNVAAYRAADGQRVWSAKVEGQAHGMAFSNGQLWVSTDAGTIHCFTTSKASE